MTRKSRSRLIALVTVISMFVGFLIAHAALALVHPSGAWRLHEPTLARVLVAEADHSRADWAAILWLFQHRMDARGETPSRIMAYSATLRSEATRPRAIRLLSSSDASARGKQVRDAESFVRDWIRGAVPDPCPTALHFHGPNDSEPGWFREVDCGATRNIFGEPRRKRE